MTDDDEVDAASADGTAADGGGAGDARRPGSAAARAASRARRMGGAARPSSGSAGQPGAGPTVPSGDTGTDTAAADGPGSATSRGRVAGARRPSPGSLSRAEVRAEAAREAAARRADWRRWIPAGVAAALVVALAIADVVLLQDWRGQPTRPERREKLLATVDAAMTKVLSYDYRHLAADASAAELSLTGTFKDQYVASINSTIKPAAPSAHPVVVGEVGWSGITSVSDDGQQAVLLVLGQQTVTNVAQKTPRSDPVTLKVTAQRVHGTWLISNLAQL
jgi:hypothetical protein